MLSAGIIKELRSGQDVQAPFTMKVYDFQKMPQGTKYSCKFSDSQDTINGVLASQLGKMVSEGSLKDPSIVSIKGFACNNVNGIHRLIVTELDVVEALAPEASPAAPEPSVGTAIAAAPAAAAATAESRGTDSKEPRDQSDSFQFDTVGPPAKKQALPAKVLAEEAAGSTPLTPQFKALTTSSNGIPATKQAAGGGAAGTPGPTPSPSEDAALRPHLATTPYQAPTPRTPANTLKGPIQPIMSLNPYDTAWTIRAKVTRKAPLRTFNAKSGGSNKVLNVEVVDEQGSQIGITLWRDAAERFADVLTEGRVYLFSRGSVKPANKQYSTLKNDYEIHMDQRGEIEECAEQNIGDKMQVAVEVTPFEQLHKFVNRKASVDLLGIVTAVGQLGSVKRKTDGSELPKRDVTLVDRGAKSVIVTLWGSNATDVGGRLEGMEGHSLLCTACKVGDYNGVSVSTLTRSQVTLDPELPAAQQLAAWWAADGCAAAVEPLTQPGAAAGSGGQPRQDKLSSIRDFLPAADAALSAADKATFHTVIAAVAAINPEQTMYYLARKEDGRKVVEREGKYWCEFDQRYSEAAEHRYVMSARIMDHSGDAYANLFDDQGRLVVGRPADDLAAMRAGGRGDEYGRALKSAVWESYVFTVRSQPREYNGEVRMRHAATSARRVDYAADGRRLLEALQGMQ